MVEVGFYPEHDRVLMAFTPREAGELCTILNSGDILAPRFYDRVPWIKSLVHELYSDYDHNTTRARFHEQYKLGRIVKDGNRSHYSFAKEA